MLRLIYTSAATSTMSQAEKRALVEESKLNNAQYGIIGVLIFMNNDFLHILEGPDEAVEQLFDHLRADARHHQIMLLTKEPIEDFTFDQAALVFIDVMEKLNIPGEKIELNKLDGHEVLNHNNKLKHIVEEFVNGKWHHHLHNGQNPMVVKR